MKIPYKTWKCEQFIIKSGKSDKKYTFKKSKSSLNHHRIKSYTYTIDFKNGNKADIH